MRPPNGDLRSEEPLLDTLLREALPEIKLALGDLIDRENQRAIPGRYSRLLPETMLVVTLRPDAAAALAPVAGEVERELSDSCTRHGSLYERAYRVHLTASEQPDAPLFRVAARAEGEEPAPLAPAPPPEPVELPGATEPTIAAPPPPTHFPTADPDATRVEGAASVEPWDPHRWTLEVEDGTGEELATHPLHGASVTVGRASERPELRPDVALPRAPHVSRRQVALVWEPRADEPGFRVYNLGLNAVHLGEREIEGANAGAGPLRLEVLGQRHSGWMAPGEALRIGERGPVLRVRDGQEVAADPDATQFE